MTKTTSRRAVLAGIATAPVLAAPALALASAGPDPIIAAIERHKVAFRISQEAGRIRCYTVDAEWAPEYDPVKLEAADEASSAADDDYADAANALITVRPTMRRRAATIPPSPRTTTGLLSRRGDRGGALSFVAPRLPRAQFNGTTPPRASAMAGSCYPPSLGPATRGLFFGTPLK
jgi:hypothetical protein